MEVAENFRHPRYWPTWCLLAIARSVSFLPYQMQLFLGRLLGQITYYLAPYRRYITATNLKLCFPEFSNSEQKNLLKKTFESMGIGVIEMAIAWFATEKQFSPKVTWHGEQYLFQALEKADPIILAGAHFTCLEIAARLFAQKFKFHLLFRPHKNKLFNHIMVQSRQQYVAKVLPRGDMRSLIRSLKQKNPVWYAPDQDYGADYSVFATFFGVTAASITGLARLATLAKATVIPVFYHRLDSQEGYEIIIHPPFENFPSGDDIKDAQIFNDLLEEDLRRCPDQYLWQHRRFKTRPTHEEKIYKKKVPFWI